MKKGDERRTQYLVSLDNAVFGDGFLDMKIEDVAKEGYVYINYGYIEDVDGAFDKWEREWEVRTLDTKTGMFHTDAKEYQGMTVREAVYERSNQDICDSSSVERVPVFCFPSKENVEYEFRNHLRNKCTHYHADGENVKGLSKSNIDKFYNWFIYGVKRTANYKLHKAQEKAIKKMKRAYEELCYSMFLLGAKPRFGKNFAILQYAKSIGAKNILFVSWLPTVFDSLGGDVTEHVDFEGWRYVDYRDKKNRGTNPYDNETPTVVSVSAQLLNHTKDEDGLKNEFSIEEMNDFRESLNSLVSSAKIDILVIDEAHFGGHTDYIDNIINTVSAKSTIYVTGTDSNFVNDGRFNVENVFEYDYFDECLDDDEHAKRMPKFRIYTFKVDKEILKVAKEYKIEEFPTFRKLFEVNNKSKFVYEDLVKIFFKTIFGKRTIAEGGKTAIKVNSVSPFVNSETSGKINNSLAILPSIKAVKAAIKLLKTIPELSEFEFIDAAGGDGIKDIKEVKNKIQTCRHYSKKTVTFVCRRFREGVTVPEWNAVFLFDDGKSFNEYIQTMFRVQSYDENKPFCYIFDYNPERCLKMRYDHINYYRKNGYTKEQMEAVLNDCMPVIYYDAEGNLVDNESFKDRLMEANHNNFKDGYDGMGTSLINEYAITTADPDYVERLNRMFNNITVSSNNNSTINGETNGISGGKFKTIVDRIGKAFSANNDGAAQKEYKRLISLCAETTKHIPEFLLACDKKYNGIIDALSDENADIFYATTNVDMCDFKPLLNGGFVNIDLLNYSIRKFYGDKEMFDLAISFQNSVYDHDTLVKVMDDFHTKWIYESDPETLDIPYSIAKMFV